jgi:mono/diheme cytochrome c family protein
MPSRLAPAALLVALALTSTVRADDAAPTFKELRPVLEAHCFQCHGPEKQRGKVDLSTFADEAAVRKHRKLWQRVAGQVKALEMPPEGEAALPPAQRDRLVRWIEQTLAVADCTNPADRDPGPAPIRRLNRSEYERTVRDLLGLEFDAATAVGMTDDPAAGGFDTAANALNVSPVLMEKYFAAADYLLDRLLPPLRDGVPSKAAPPGARPDDRKAAEALLFVRPGKAVDRRDAARQVLARVARRAYRRPVQDAEVERLMKLFDAADTNAGRFEDALRLPLKAVLVSPHFLFRIEQDGASPKSEQPTPVDDHALAVRLSYFLWSSMPDDELFRLADAKRLSDPATYDGQVKRMLADPKARALTDNFAAQWLQLRKLPEARPSTEFFPTFNDRLRRAMHDETAAFFDHLRTADRPVLDLLDADYTFVNEDLARHYGLAGVKGPQLRKTQLKPGDHRGGLLGMGSVLALTSHTSRTSPTLRGKWILEVVFGTPPPPPPPDAGQLNEKQGKGAPKSFRELLALHARQPTCAACHNKMDPLGFALENYDAVGRWRDSHGGRPLETTGKLPTGETFTGPAELKKILLGRKDAFARNLAEQLLVYALGRELGADDECAVRDLTEALRRDDYRFSTLVRGVATSYPFQYRRDPATKAAE